MALYSFGRIKTISRNGAKSAVATAAYHSGTVLRNEYDGVLHDYSKKQDVGETYIRMPEGVPAAWRDETVPAKERLGVIWNAVEKASLADNARLARSNFLALQNELTLEQNLECVDEWIKKNCTDCGMGCAYSVHHKKGNLHVDVMYLVNEYDGKGFVKTKAKKEYLCRDREGQEMYFSAEDYKQHREFGWEKVYKYQKDGERKDMTPSEAFAEEGWERINKYPVCRTVKVSGWDFENLAKKWRKSWEEILNAKFEELGMDIRLDCRSYAERGLGILPTKHVGWGSDREENLAYNEDVREYNNAVNQLYNVAMDELDEVRHQLLHLSRQPQTEQTLRAHQDEYNQHAEAIQSIARSELLGQKRSQELLLALRRLRDAVRAALTRWKEFLFGGSHQEAQKATQAAEEELDGFQDTLADILSDATRRSQAADKGGQENDDFIK